MGEGLVWGLAVALVISFALNLAFLIIPRTRETVLSLVRRIMNQVQGGRFPNTIPPPLVPEISNAKPEMSGTIRRPPPPPLPIRSVRPHSSQAPMPTPTPSAQPFRTGNKVTFI